MSFSGTNPKKSSFLRKPPEKWIQAWRFFQILISPGSLVLELKVLVHMVHMVHYNNFVESYITCGDIAETQGKGLLSGTNEVRGDVVGRWHFQCRLLWMVPGQMACHHLILSICLLVWFEYKFQKCSDHLPLLIITLWFIGYLSMKLLVEP